MKIPSPPIIACLPWTEPNQWCFTGSKHAHRIGVLSLPHLHSARRRVAFLRSVAQIRKRIDGAECLISWELTTALACSIARRLYLPFRQPELIALGIIDKSVTTIQRPIIKRILNSATTISAFSTIDSEAINTWLDRTDVCVSPTVWNPSAELHPSDNNNWIAVGKSLRDDKTLALAASRVPVHIQRYCFSQCYKSPTMTWHLSNPPLVIERAYYEHAMHAIALETDRWSAGLSSVVCGGFASQCVVATDTQSIRQIITHGVSGLLVPVGDSVRFADAMRSVTEDRNLRAKLAKNLREVCTESHTYQCFVQHVAALRGWPL